jgi:inorganic triphosphatase YgiF
MEIEAKFRVSCASVFQALLRYNRLGDFAFFAAPQLEHQRNTYFDTTDRHVTRMGHTIRVRDLGHQRIAAVKCSRRSDGAVREREEWEVAITSSDHPSCWPTSEARQRALALVGLTPLEALITVHTRRHYMYAMHEGREVAELSLDEGVISAGGRVVGFRELEVELMPDGTRCEFDRLVGLLRAHLPLTPEPRSKKARGLALLDHATSYQTPPAAPLALTLG